MRDLFVRERGSRDFRSGGIEIRGVFICAGTKSAGFVCATTK